MGYNWIKPLSIYSYMESQILTMTKEELFEYVSCGNEIEFDYKGASYSITYFEKNQKSYISFCEFYQEPIDVETFEELIQIHYKGAGLMEMLESLTEEDMWIS